MTEPAAGIRGIKIALAAYAILLVVQLVAYFLTNVLVLFAQALEMTSDVVVSSFLLLAVYWSRKPPDTFHMFGHGRAQNVAALVSGTIMILFMGLEVFREAVPKLLESPGENVAQDTGLALIVIVASMAVLAVPLMDLLRGKQTGGSVKAQMIQLVKDEVAYVPALIGVVLVGLGYAWADPLTSVIIGGVIVVSGAYLFKDNVHYLVGRSPGKEFLERVEAAARSVPEVLGVHDVKAEYVGPGVVHAGLHIEVAKGTTIEQADQIVKEVDDRVSREAGCQDCIIHVDPASA